LGIELGRRLGRMLLSILLANLGTKKRDKRILPQRRVERNPLGLHYSPFAFAVE
jgi:hypothetical protein